METAAPPFSGSIDEGVRISGFNRNEIYKLIESGEVRSVKLARKRIIDFASLRAAVARRMRRGIDPELSKQMAKRRRGK